MNESVFFGNRHLASFSVCLFFLRQNFGKFSAIWARREVARKRRDEGSLCIPGEEAIARGGDRKKSQVQKLPVTGQ